MSPITAILQPDANGTLHLQMPKSLWHSKVRVVATPLEDDPAEARLSESDEAIFSLALQKLRAGAGLHRREVPAEEQELRRQTAMKALELLRQSNPYSEIDDVVAWQSELRKDRPLPFRD